MTDDERGAADDASGVTDDARGAIDDEVETGEPIGLLADLEEPVPTRVRERVRNSIRRRHFGGDLLDFAILAPGMVLVTYVTGFFAALAGPSTDSDDHPQTLPTRTPRDQP